MNPKPKPSVKPRLRGVSHEIACYLSVIAGAFLVLHTRGLGAGPRALVGTSIYAVCLFLLFMASALYHRPHWQPRARALMRRVDHSAIYLMIAGTLTPIALVAGRSTQLLTVMWIGAGLGLIKTLLWVHAPKPLTAAAYVVFAAACAPFLPRLAPVIGASNLELMLAGAGLYLAGAVVYSLKRPNPMPAVFGYHEIFHALVIAAAGIQYWAIFRIIGSVA